MRNTLRWLVVWNLALGAATGYGFWVDRKQDISRCESRNDATEAAVLLGAEAIIEVAGAEPERVEQYRKVLDRHIDEARADC